MSRLRLGGFLMSEGNTHILFAFALDRIFFLSLRLRIDGPRLPNTISA